MEDVYEPLEEGLDVVVDKKLLVCMEVLLSKKLNDMNTDGIGYSDPLSED